MTLAFGPGAIVIEARVADGRVCAATIRSSRPRGMARLFQGRPASEIPDLAARLFSLCGFSQRVAASLAIGAARVSPPSPGRCAAFEFGLAAERAAEILRGCVLGWPRGEAGPRIEAEEVLALRDGLSAARELIESAGRESFAGTEVRALGRRLAEAAARLGLEGDGAARRNSCFARISREAADGDHLPVRVPDALAPEDDAEVIGALARDPDFAAEPALRGRIAETGAFARLWRDAGDRSGALQARFAARLIDLADSLHRLEAAATDGASDSLPFAAAALAPRDGYAAVESPRGRLYHRVALEPGEDRAARYAMVAPTEWNFHPAGPLAAALIGARVGSGEAARLRIARVAALFDPCVALRVEIREAGHA
jgi:hypothetical protein